MIFMLIILAALTKSAQVPFSAWLPAAIAAPTPVSALVHSSTLVTAGVYLLIRFNEIVGCSKFLFFVRLLTIFLSGVGACFEQDAKKIVALSTLRQLGVIMFSLSMGLWEIAFFHLLSHALFKSLLFMCMGIYIHGINNQQDLRGIGFQFNSMPIVSSYFLVSSISLRGFPFLSGFYSRDSIIELFQSSVIGLFSYFLVMVCVLRTVLYRIRLIFSLYAVEINSRVLVLGVREYFLSLLPIMLLFVVSVIGGSLFFSRTVPLFMLGFSLFFRGLITLTVVGLILTLSLILYISCILRRNLKLGVSGVGLSLIWFLEDFFRLLRGVLGSRRKVLQGVDQGWVEFVGVQGVISNIKKTIGGLDLGTEVGVGIYLYGGLFIVLFIFLM
jgi:NADH-ubiquinone oxidoreductase chain 5